MYLSVEKMNLFIHLLMPLSKLPPDSYYHTHREKDITHFPQAAFFFWKSWYFFPDKKGRARNLWAEKIIKINLCWYWSQVLINPTFFVFVLLCHNLDSGMLKCKDFNTTKKKSTKKVYRNNCMKDEMLPYPIF